MCLDGGTHAAFSSFQEHLLQRRQMRHASSAGDGRMSTPSRQEELHSWTFRWERPDAEDTEAPLPTPFFTPQHPIASFRGSQEVAQMSLRIFNGGAPGFGVAFIRATGLVHDYPRSASKFLLQESIDRKDGTAIWFVWVC